MTEQTEQTAETLADDPPVVDLDTVVAEEIKPDDDKKPEPEQAEKTQAEGDADADSDGEPKPKKLSGAARAKLREQRLLNELSETQRKLEEVQRATAQAKPASESAEKAPEEKDYNGDWFAYQRALTAFEAGKKTQEAIEKVFQSREETERKTKQAEAVRERALAHAERVEDAREVIADFDKTMDAMKGVDVRTDVIEEIMSSDKSALLAYHLAKNPHELQALNSMSGRELARAMGRLEATVNLPVAKKQTTAPSPLSTVKGGASPSSPESDLNAWLRRTYGKGA